MSAAPAGTLVVEARAARRSLTGVLTIADQGVSSATTFLTTVLVGRSTSKEEFGAYVLGLTVLAWVTNLQTAFVTSPYLYRQASLPDPARRRLAGSTLIHHVALALGVTAIVATVAAAAGWAGSPRVAMVAWGLAVCLAPTLVKEYGRQVSFAHGRPQDALVLDGLGLILQVGGLWWLVDGGLASAAGAFVVIGVACGLSGAGWLAVRRGAFRPDRAIAGTHLADNWVLGRWLFAGFLVNAVGKDLYGWFLTGFHGPAAAAVLAACLGIVNLASPLAVGTGNYLAATYARLLADQGRPALVQRVRRETVIASGAAALFVAGVWVLGDAVQARLFGSQYHGNTAVLTLLALSVGMTVVTLPLGVGMLASQRADLTFRAGLIGAAATVVIGVVGAWALGPLGAALGLVSASTAEGLAKWLLFRRHVQPAGGAR